MEAPCALSCSECMHDPRSLSKSKIFAFLLSTTISTLLWHYSTNKALFICTMVGGHNESLTTFCLYYTLYVLSRREQGQERKGSGSIVRKWKWWSNGYWGYGKHTGGIFLSCFFYLYIYSSFMWNGDVYSWLISTDSKVLSVGILFYKTRKENESRSWLFGEDWIA